MPTLLQKFELYINITILQLNYNFYIGQLFLDNIKKEKLFSY